ncbi:hypothetical protein TruAng_000219 [Truncatella angustata]|nr:hypothetical protein TruAng_000219 [Truncatella angustata]
MSKPNEYPPAYDGPNPPQAAYQQQGYGQPGPYGGDNGYYQSNPNMGYQQQGPPQGGYYQQGPYPPQQGGPYPPQQGYPPQGQHQEQSSSSSGCCQGILAALACCCCLECLF